MLIVGIDIAKRSHEAFTLRDRRCRLRSDKFAVFLTLYGVAARGLQPVFSLPAGFSLRARHPRQCRKNYPPAAGLPIVPHQSNQAVAPLRFVPAGDLARCVIVHCPFAGFVRARLDYDGGGAADHAVGCSVCFGVGSFAGFGWR